VQEARIDLDAYGDWSLARGEVAPERTAAWLRDLREADEFPRPTPRWFRWSIATRRIGTWSAAPRVECHLTLCSESHGSSRIEWQLPAPEDAPQPVLRVHGEILRLAWTEAEAGGPPDAAFAASEARAHARLCQGSTPREHRVVEASGPIELDWKAVAELTSLDDFCRSYRESRPRE
jgi:hypothetical protein